MGGGIAQGLGYAVNALGQAYGGDGGGQQRAPPQYTNPGGQFGGYYGYGRR
jgi:hypothetical protein